MIVSSGQLLPCGVGFPFLLPTVFFVFFSMFFLSMIVYCSQSKHRSHCLTVRKDTLYALSSETVISKFCTAKESPLTGTLFSCSMTQPPTETLSDSSLMSKNSVKSSRLTEQSTR